MGKRLCFVVTFCDLRDGRPPGPIALKRMLDMCHAPLALGL